VTTKSTTSIAEVTLLASQGPDNNSLQYKCQFSDNSLKIKISNVSQRGHY
jgi:membrane-bound inhibitor of C-type lysozyme